MVQYQCMLRSENDIFFLINCLITLKKLTIILYIIPENVNVENWRLN